MSSLTALTRIALWYLWTTSVDGRMAPQKKISPFAGIGPQMKLSPFGGIPPQKKIFPFIGPFFDTSCPSDSVHLTKFRKNLGARVRSRRSPIGNVLQYNTKASRRNFLAIGRKMAKSGFGGPRGSYSVKGSVCDKTKCYRPLERGKKCPGVDLIFVMDCSGSIDSKEWRQLTKFVKDTASIFDVGLGTTRVAAINFGTTACVQFNFGAHKNNNELYSGIDEVPKCGGSTHLAKAMDLATNKVLNRKLPFDRPEVLNICMVFTDGQANGPGDVKRAADRLREAGCEVYAIGIGDNLSKRQLLTVAGGDSNKVIVAKSFRNLLENSVLCTKQ